MTSSSDTSEPNLPSLIASEAYTLPEKIGGGHRLGLRHDEFVMRVMILSKRLENHYRSKEVLSEPELRITIDTTIIFLLRWIPDCWVVAVELGLKCQQVFRRLLSSAFYMRRMFRYFRSTIANMNTTHKLKISYASGKLHQSMEYNTQTAFYPIGWTLQAVWERMMHDIGENIASDFVFFEYCKLFDQARRVLPAKVWKYFFAKSSDLKDSLAPLVMKGETSEHVRPCTTAGEAAEATSNSPETLEVPNSTPVEGDTATLKSRQIRLLESPDAQNEVSSLKNLPDNGFDAPLFILNESLPTSTTLTSERESILPTNGSLSSNFGRHLYDDLYL